MESSFEKQTATFPDQDILDALSLAFWDSDFEPCTVEQLPFDKDALDFAKVGMPVMREKSTYDPAENCAVEITQFQFSYAGDAEFEAGRVDVLTIQWDSGKFYGLGFDANEGIVDIGFFDYVDSAADPELGDLFEVEGEHRGGVKSEIKAALAQVTTLLD